MAKEVHWRIALDGDDDLAVLRLVVDKGKVTRFAIHYRAVIRGREVDVVRYDTCHGFLHVHRMWLDPANEILALERAGMTQDYSAAVEAAKRDLLSNWRAYRAQMELKE